MSVLAETAIQCSNCGAWVYDDVCIACGHTVRAQNYHLHGRYKHRKLTRSEQIQREIFARFARAGYLTREARRDLELKTAVENLIHRHTLDLAEHLTNVLIERSAKEEKISLPREYKKLHQILLAALRQWGDAGA